MHQEQFLRRALVGNAVFSAICAPALGFFAPWLSEQLGLAVTWPIYIVAVGLLGFAGLIVTILLRSRPNGTAVLTVVGGDALWIVATPVLLCLYMERITGAGILVSSTVAAMVLLFAVLQSVGLWKVARE